MTPSQEDSAVVDAFRAGDEMALADLYARWSPLVYSLSLRSLGDVTKAEEVTQRVFTRAWLTRETFDPTRARLAGWLVALTRDSLADPGPLPGTGVPAGRKPVEESVERESKTGVLAEQLVVADAVSHLDTLSRGVLRMALEHHLTLAEIAGRTGLRVDQVRSRVASSLTTLRERVEVDTDAR